MTTEEEEYLGDGIYVAFDGFGFMLRAPREGVDHWIYLEPALCRKLALYIESITDAMKENREHST